MKESARDFAGLHVKLKKLHGQLTSQNQFGNVMPNQAQMGV